jgi:hypothetical protein
MNMYRMEEDRRLGGQKPVLAIEIWIGEDILTI